MIQANCAVSIKEGKKMILSTLPVAPDREQSSFSILHLRLRQLKAALLWHLYSTKKLKIILFQWNRFN